MKLLHNNVTYFMIAVSIVCTLSLDSFAQRFGGFTQGRTTAGSTSDRYYYPTGMIGDAIIEADHDSRSIVIIADEETNRHIQDIIRNLDRPVQQVLIKVVFVEVTYRDDYDFGLEASLDVNNNRSGSNIFDTAFGLAAETRGGFYRLFEKDVNVILRAISEVGKLEVLSRPSILTRNNQEAIITVGSEVPFITSSQITNQGNTINVVEYEDIGIILRVTPFITKEGLVEMILAPEISTLTDESVPISETIRAPVFAKRAADTVVVTPNGQTVVIGGMMEDNTIEVVNKVPLLGDIPILGMAFRRTRVENSKTELMIFLTPYVVEGPDRLIDMSIDEMSKTEVLPKAFPDERMEKYMNVIPRENNSQIIEDESQSESVQAIKEENTQVQESSEENENKASPFGSRIGNRMRSR